MNKLSLGLCALLSSSAYGYLDFSQSPSTIVIKNNANVSILKDSIWKYDRTKYEFNTIRGQAHLNFTDISSLTMHGSLRTYNGTLNFDMNKGGRLDILGGGSWSADTSDMNNNYNALIATLEGVNNFEMGNRAIVNLQDGVRAFGIGASNRFLMDNSTLYIKGTLAVSANGGSENLIQGSYNEVEIGSISHEQTGDAGSSNNTLTLTDGMLKVNGNIFSNWGNLQQGGNYFTLTGGKQMFMGNISIDDKNGGYNRFEFARTDVTFGGKQSHIQYMSANENTVIRYQGDLKIDEIEGDNTASFVKETPEIALIDIKNGSGQYAFKSVSPVLIGQLVAITPKTIAFTTESYDDGLVVTTVGLRKEDNGGVWNWFVDEDMREISTQAIAQVKSSIATPYETYLFNFNSLNKRMGELRNNKNTHGVWARIFGGQGSNSMNDTSTAFVSIQSGYDYGFEVDGAKNYLGLAISYGYGDTSSLKTNLVDVALYNSYIQDEGWFNDTVLKAGMLSNDYLNNTATFSLSNEVGYRFKLGEDKRWFIDPQAELSIGYIGGNTYSLSNAFNKVDVKQNPLLIMRSRLGSSFGYDFIKENLKSSVYVGLFAEIDNFYKGNATLSAFDKVADVKNQLGGNDYRGVLNYGFNAEVKDHLSLYFDMEHSFGGQLKLDYKINAGVRFKFGEKAIDKPEESEAPLKLQESN